ncbi:MAG: DUF4342 domain-containing protein [Firmicutes bacterium]|nr:DUF4342 domain-containing protein [Bacillota bacterium]
MEITLEKIELVKDRTGVGYKEAKDALEKTDGSVVDAIILIEDTIDESTKEGEKKNVEILNTVKEAVRKGNVSKIVIKKGDEIVMNLPVNIGIIGTVLFPWAAIGGCIAALGTKCSIELVKEDGAVVNVSEKAAKTFETVKDKGSVIYDEVKDKGGDLFETAKDKGSDLFEAAKDKSGDLFEAARDKGGSIYESARDKGGDLYEAAKDKLTRDKAVDPDETFAKNNDFDLSDLDLDEMEEDK